MDSALGKTQVLPLGGFKNGLEFLLLRAYCILSPGFLSRLVLIELSFSTQLSPCLLLTLASGSSVAWILEERAEGV